MGALNRSWIVVGSVLVSFITAVVHGQQPKPSPPTISADKDGTLHIRSLDLPSSTFASPEANKVALEVAAQTFAPTGPLDVPGPAVEQFRDDADKYLFAPALREVKSLYPAVTIQATTIAGIKAKIFEPAAGIPPENSNRVLINIHGGAFFLRFALTGELESIPITSVGRFKVVSIDYREGPEYEFPAASEDVAAVYKELLKKYKPQNIGLYGCSAGGYITAQALAWMQKEHLPKPGAAAILCGGGAFGGDSANLWSKTLPGNLPPVRNYFKNVADMRDPLISPANSPVIMAGFPPTLIITSSRATDLSGAIYTDVQLTRAGVDSELHVWDGLVHGIYVYDTAASPEARDTALFVAKFFAKHLGK